MRGPTVAISLLAAVAMAGCGGALPTDPVDTALLAPEETVAEKKTAPNPPIKKKPPKQSVEFRKCIRTVHKERKTKLGDRPRVLELPVTAPCPPGYVDGLEDG